MDWQDIKKVWILALFRRISKHFSKYLVSVLYIRFIENLSYSCFIWHLPTIWFEYNKILELNCKTDSVELLHQAEMIWILQKVSELSSKLVYFSIIVVLVKYYWLFLNFWHNSFQFLFHKFLDIWKLLMNFSNFKTRLFRHDTNKPQTEKDTYFQLNGW